MLGFLQLTNPVTKQDFRREGGNLVEYNPQKAKELHQ